MTFFDRDPRRGSPPGIILDANAEEIGTIPSASVKDSVGLVDSLLDAPEKARLADFCAAPSPLAGGSGGSAADYAVFRLRSEKYPFGVAVKGRRFSGDCSVLYLMGKDGGLPPDPFFERRLPVLSREIGRRMDLSSAGGLGGLTEAVVRRTSALPELSCGEAIFTGCGGDGGRDFPVCAPAFADAAALLISVLNFASACHRTEISVFFREGGPEVRFLTRDGALSLSFSRSSDLASLSLRLPSCLEKLSFASYLCSSAGIDASVFSGPGPGDCGFLLSFRAVAASPEFKLPEASFSPDQLLFELSAFIGGAVPFPR